MVLGMRKYRSHGLRYCQLVCQFMAACDGVQRFFNLWIRRNVGWNWSKRRLGREKQAETDVVKGYCETR